MARGISKRILTVMLGATVAACGAAEKPNPRPAVKPHRVRPEDARCSDLATKAAAHKLARKLVDRVVAPDGQSERETIGIIGESLYATCRQPRLPGVGDVKAYRPVKPVLAAVQRDFDEEEIAGG